MPAQTPKLTSELLSGVPDPAVDAVLAEKDEMEQRMEYHQYMLCRLADVGVVTRNECAACRFRSRDSVLTQSPRFPSIYPVCPGGSCRLRKPAGVLVEGGALSGT